MLPRIFGYGSLRNDTHKSEAFCNQNRTAVTDLISMINDADEENPEQIKFLASYLDTWTADQFNDFAFSESLAFGSISDDLELVFYTTI